MCFWRALWCSLSFIHMIRSLICTSMWNSKIINYATSSRMLERKIMLQLKRRVVRNLRQFAVCCQMISLGFVFSFSLIVSIATLKATCNLLIDLSPCKWTVISVRKITFSRCSNTEHAFSALSGWACREAKCKNLVERTYKRSCSFRLWLLQNG